MSNVQDYNSRLSDTASRKLGTFSYLPSLTEDELRKQVEYILSKGWNPGIEHTEPENAMANYWYMWKLPMFGETAIEAVFREIEACKKANPANHVRLIGYDNIKQSQGTAMLVHRAEISA